MSHSDAYAAAAAQLHRSQSDIVSNRSLSPPSRPDDRPLARRRSDGASWPLPAYLEFVPGGIGYRPSSHYAAAAEERGVVHLHRHCNVSGGKKLSVDTGGPERIVVEALQADVALRRYALHCAQRQQQQRGCDAPTTNVGHRLPSLSILAEAAFVDPLTAVPASSAVSWAEAMIVEYMDGRYEELVSDTANPFCDLPAAARGEDADAALLCKHAIVKAWTDEERTTGRTPTNTASPRNSNNDDNDIAAPYSVRQSHHLPAPTVSALLSALHALQSGPDDTNTRRPCGYVFRRNDIAWNCRTCQTDATCVVCDECFRHSDHVGHEVFFHRTTPGGCCDCGDLEAWRFEGCCELHRPVVQENTDEEDAEDGVGGSAKDDYEAVRTAKRGRTEHIRHVVDGSNEGGEKKIPPRLAAALGVVIGSIVKTVQVACQFSAEGADVSQWRVSLADEVCRVWNGISTEEEYYRRGAVLEAFRANSRGEGSVWTLPENVLDASSDGYTWETPKKYKFHLRLHNDDVHTFEEVINTLHHSSHDPTKVPSGGAGSIGAIGGRGYGGYEFPVSEELLVKKKKKEDTVDSPSISMEGTTATTAMASTENVTMAEPGESKNSDKMNIHPEVDPTSPLVSRIDVAQDLTRRVDADGQVLVRDYESLDGAGIGFARLREGGRLTEGIGLHGSVVSTPRTEAEERARVLLEWLAGLIGVHPAVASMVVQALVDVTDGEDALGAEDASGGVAKGVAVWNSARMMPCWSGTHEKWWDVNDPTPAWKRRLEAFPPHLESSYLTREEGRKLFHAGLTSASLADKFVVITGVDPDFYANVPYSLPDSQLLKSPHALWGTLPSTHLVDKIDGIAHPLLRRLSDPDSDSNNDTRVRLRPRIFVVDTDLRKHQEGVVLTSTLYPHKLHGLKVVSGICRVDEYGTSGSRYGDEDVSLTSREYAKNLISCSSFVAPMSPILQLLLLDPYAPKLVRSSLQRLFLSLLTDGRFKSRFAASLGAVAYRPTSSLFCAGIGTEADTLLGFTVQLFTTGSLVKALGNLDATRSLLCREDFDDEIEYSCITALPIAYSVVRCIHTNILGATLAMLSTVMNGITETSERAILKAALPQLSYQFGSEHPLNTRLPAAPDDKFIDSRCMKHKRVPHLVRDLEYIFETPGTAVKLLTSVRSTNPPTSPDNAVDMITPAPSFTYPTSGPNSLATYSVSNPIDFPSLWTRLLRLGQGIDLQKRRISGGHVEYEDERWLGAYGLSLNLSGTGDALSESPFASISFGNEAKLNPALIENMRSSNKEAMGNLFGAFFREIKMWLYREGILEFDSSRYLPHVGELESLQRSTLHVSVSQLDESCVQQISAATGLTVADSCDVACETAVKNLPEAKLALLEAALLYERVRLTNLAKDHGVSSHGPLMGDWLKVPNSPLAGECLSFHLPLHRSLARSIRCFCSAIVPSAEREANPNNWWRLPLLDDDDDFASPDLSSINGIILKQDCLSAIVRPTHRSSNLRVVWSAGPDCSPQEAQSRRSRARLVSSALSSTKVVHSLCDHPLRCIAASQQIEHHMWAKNGGSVAGMALNYSSVPLCRSLKDLDITMVQLSAAGFNVGLGARRVFALLINRFSLDGYLCDPDRRNMFGKMGWVKPPRLQEVEHAELLAESFFTTLCVLVSDLPPPPPMSPQDDVALRDSLKRELLHALAVEPKSHSEAMTAAAAAISRRDESDGGSVGGTGASPFRVIFNEVLRSIAQQRSQGTRATGPPTFELKPEGSNEYDPSYYHLRKTDHQHAMDNIARLRKQKLSVLSKNENSDMVLPLVAEPPKGHPRFLPSRLILHLPSMYSAIRRYLMYALFNGQWLPPAEPKPIEISIVDSNEDDDMPLNSLEAAKTNQRSFRRATSEASNVSSTTNVKSVGTTFSPATVAASSKSFLEVLQLLTLQAHTLEECSRLHKDLPFLDHEQKYLSASIDVKSYLCHLVHVPNSLVNVWALLCAPDGPLPSEGSGENRGSVLGLCIALFEHRDADNNNGAQKSANDDHGGSRTLSADGLKWFLRFVSALVDGAESVSVARQSATYGTPIDDTSPSLDIDTEIREKIQRMLANLPNLWPRSKDPTAPDDLSSSAHEKSKEARKAAQARVLAKMRKQQDSFAASISSQFKDESEKKLMDDDEENLCIICRCDDADGDNGPMGYLGHVQRSRVLHLESKALYASGVDAKELNLSNVYRVVGDKGCQLRSTESMESAPVAFIPQGGFVEILQSKMEEHINIQSRRVFVKHLAPQNDKDEAVQGWASVQSWEGYVILSPLSSLCYSNARWGSTRPVIRQCGHSAHLRCAEQHCLSLHQRAAGNQPYDGRFSANIDDGEFLCPLCKQLSNIVIPEDACIDAGGQSIPISPTSMSEVKEGFEIVKSDVISSAPPADTALLRNILSRKCSINVSEASTKNVDAIHQFGSNLLQAMILSSDGSSAIRKRHRKNWHPALRRWDFEDDDLEQSVIPGVAQIGSCLRLMRQLLISWSAVGHSAAAAETSGRGVQQVVFGEMTYSSIDPWSNFAAKNRDSHPMLLELRRTLSATSSLVDVVGLELGKQLRSEDSKSKVEVMSVVGSLLSDILEGNSWALSSTNGMIEKQWQLVTPLITSMLCHVSKEDTLPARLEARAVAASMWTITGSHPPPPKSPGNGMDVDSSPGVEIDQVGNVASQESDTIIASRSNDAISPPPPKLPPKPLSVYRAERNLSSELDSNWGTLNPFVLESQPDLPFRPAVASAYLYVPLLAWDLNTFSGALFSSLLSNSGPEPSVSTFELLQSAKLLLTSRLIQVLAIPDGFICTNVEEDGDEFDDFDDDEDCWDDEKKKTEASAINDLLSACKKYVQKSTKPHRHGLDDASLIQAVGNAILPFARSLVLLLRASTSIIRQRKRRLGDSGSTEETNADKIASSLLERSDLMTSEDGFKLLERLGAPLPSEIKSQRSWNTLVDRWLKSFVAFEACHGTRGHGLIFDKTNSWIPSQGSNPSPTKRAANGGDSPCHKKRDLSAFHNLHVETSSGAVEVARQSQPQNDDFSIPSDDSEDEVVDIMDEDLADSDEELEHVDDMDIDMDNFDFRNQGRFGMASSSLVSSDLDFDMNDDASDVNDALPEPDGSTISGPDDVNFAHVSRAVIIPYQSSISGTQPIGPGPRGKRGETFEYKIANHLMKDLSHLGMIHVRGSPLNCLVKLPKSFVELYGIVNRVKGREGRSDESEDGSGFETAICLLTGAVMRSGTSGTVRRMKKAPGTCTLHARKVGSGIGIFFLVQKCTVLLMHNNKSAYSPSLYVDEHGEEDVGLRRGRPLFFSEERYQALEKLWRSHGIPREVSQIRSTSDRVIRDNWY